VLSRLGESKSNEMEALLVKKHVKLLVDAGMREEDIAVITPYNAQVCVPFHLPLFRSVPHNVQKYKKSLR
jgi:hypothetical protein